MSSKEDQHDDIVIPSEREVNKQIRAEARRERAKSKQYRKNVGGLRRIADEAVKRFENRPLEQLKFIKDNCRGIGAVIGRAREVGLKREDDLFTGLGRCLAWVREAGGRCNNVTDFNRKHFLMVMSVFDEKADAGDMVESTVKHYVSIMKRMTELLGRDNAVPEGRELVELLQRNGISAGTLRREYIAELAVGWRDCGIDVDGLIMEVARHDPLHGIWFSLMENFGLRVKEVVCLQPEVSWKGDYLHVYRGTKGDKSRDVPLFKDPARRAKQIDVITRAIAISRANRKGEMGVPGFELKQTLERVRTVCRKFGITKGSRGIVPHGLRHQFGCDLFKDRCGLPAPVLHVVSPQVYKEREADVREAMVYVSRALGHERPSITTAYTGSPGKLTKQDKLLRATLERLQGASSAFINAGVAEAWVIGAHAKGVVPRQAGPLMVAVRFAASEIRSTHSIELARAITSCMGSPAFVIVVDARPDEGVEILFARVAGQVAA